MSKQTQYEMEGVVERVMGNNNYLVRIPIKKGGHKDIKCHLAGKMRQYKISVISGDKVRIICPPPFDKGRITFRERVTR